MPNTDSILKFRPQSRFAENQSLQFSELWRALRWIACGGVLAVFGLQISRAAADGNVGSFAGIARAMPSGTVLQAEAAIRQGRWKSTRRFDGYTGENYLVTADPKAWLEFVTSPQSNHLPIDGGYSIGGESQNEDSEKQKSEVRLIYVAQPGLGKSVPVAVTYRGLTTTRLLDLTKPGDDGFSKPIGRYHLAPGESIRVRISAAHAGGRVAVDAIWWPNP